MPHVMTFVSIILTALAPEVRAAPAALTQAFTGIKTVKVHSPEGRTEIVQQAQAQVNVQIEKLKFDEKACVITQNRDGDALLVEVNRTSRFAASVNCQTRIQIVVPAGLAITANQISGELALNDLTGVTKATTVAAAVHAKNITGEPTYIQTVSGDVRLNYSKKPPSDLNIKTVSGSAVLDLKADAAIRFHSISGHLKSKRSTGDASASKINFKSVSGDFTWN